MSERVQIFICHLDEGSFDQVGVSLLRAPVPRAMMRLGGRVGIAGRRESVPDQEPLSPKHSGERADSPSGSTTTGASVENKARPESIAWGRERADPSVPRTPAARGQPHSDNTPSRPDPDRDGWRS